MRLTQDCFKNPVDATLQMDIGRKVFKVRLDERVDACSDSYQTRVTEERVNALVTPQSKPKDRFSVDETSPSNHGGLTAATTPSHCQQNDDVSILNVLCQVSEAAKSDEATAACNDDVF